MSRKGFIAPEAPAGMAGRIIGRIEEERRGLLVRRAWTWGLALGASGTLAGYGWFATEAQAAHSGFFTFASLFFSNFSAAAANFSDFFLSVAETFPVFAAALFLSGVFFAVWSAARFAREISLLRHPALRP